MHNSRAMGIISSYNTRARIDQLWTGVTQIILQ